ncbi:hypothetical protein NliqN6_0931 [Naganishia liquefaciens]|uniref:BRCT domain-containing protein n=1 Tax=Naganishia liquefaciens TaxID=104408 RepID=A0A8H3TQM7_9TREE|nr:hypothetical protein NliqN6_0931 [Naganishia liquefaciens]
MPPHAAPHYRIPAERPHPPMNYPGSRNSSPRDAQYERGTHSPIVPQLAGGSSRHDSHPRMSPATGLDHPVITDRRDLASSARHQSPQPEVSAISDGRNGRRVLAGLAAGMASPEQSMRSGRGDPRESYEQGNNQNNGYRQPESVHQAQMQRQAAYAFSPIPPTQIADAELLTLLRYAPHPQIQRTQAASARSSVVPGTPSERGDETMHADHEMDNVRRSTPLPLRDFARSLHQSGDPFRNGALATRHGQADHIITIASSPDTERPDFTTLPNHPVQPDLHNSLSRAEETDSLEPTQRNDELIYSPPEPKKQPSTRTTPAKTPAKAQKSAVVQNQSKPILPRPANTAPETDEDTFIFSQDRKVALKKRSNAEIEACMDDVQPALLTETISPNKRKKASIKQKDGVLGAAREAKKVARRGELQNHKVTSGVVALAKTAAAEVAVAGLPRGISPIEASAEIDKPFLQDIDKMKELRDNLFLHADGSTPPIADVTTKVAARIAPHRRLQKTSVAGSSGPRSDPASLRGIDEYEKRGAVVVENAHLEETQIAQSPDMANPVAIEHENHIRAPLPNDNGKDTDPASFSAREAKVSIEHENRSRSTSLTSAPESEGDQPQIETLVVPSPQRFKTYKSPAKKRRIQHVKDFSPNDEQPNESETDESPKRRRLYRKQRGPSKKIMSPTASPPSREKSREVRSNSSTDSLSEAPREENWDDIPPPVMKDDPKDSDFRPHSHSQTQPSPIRKIATRRKSMTPRPSLQLRRVMGLWEGAFYTGTLIGKKGRKYTVQFDDEPSGYDRSSDELRQCVFHVGDEVSLHYSMERKLNESGTLEVLGPVDDELDMASPLLADDMLRLRGRHSRIYEVAVKHCTFDEENDEVLNDRFFDEAQLDDMCHMSDANAMVRTKKTARDHSVKIVNGKQPNTRPVLRGQARSDSRLDRSRPLQNFAFVISSNPNVEDKSAMTRSYKAKIIGAGGRVMNDFFEFYPKPRGDRISADDIALAKHHHALHGIFLLILPPKEPKAPYLTEKYMMALALGIPCLSALYIDELLDEDETTSWRTFLLSAGLSLQLKSEVSQVVNWNAGEGPQHLVKKIDAEGVTRRPFANRSFLISAGINYVIPYVCAAMGAESVILSETKTRSRKGTSVPPSAAPSVISEDSSERSTADVDFIVVPDDAPKSKSKKNAEKICNVEWVKQCLIMGKLYHPSIMEKTALTNGH